jgi:hypothetical protein
MLKKYLFTFPRGLADGPCVSLARFPTACAVCLSFLPLATAWAQLPQVQTNVENLRPIPWIRGEANLRHRSKDPVDQLMCGPATVDKGYSYPYYPENTVRLKFSCGLRNPTTAFGSWIIEDLHPSGARHVTIFAGTFSRATLNRRMFASPPIFVLEGNVTIGQRDCSGHLTAGKRIRIVGKSGDRTAPALFEIFDNTGVIMTGTFRENPNISTGVGGVWEVNQRLHLDKPDR